MSQEFDKYFKRWVKSACKEWGYPEPSDEYYRSVYSRLPAGLRNILSKGLENGIILPQDPLYKFRLKDLAPKKGPYQWFENVRSNKFKPAPCWEYFVQVAEFVRLYHAVTPKGLILKVEHKYMDIGIYDKDKLLVCYETKMPEKIKEIIPGIFKYEQKINFDEPDRNNDALQKAKYIAINKPEYFCVVTIGHRFEYRVNYPEDKAFQLTRDMVPWI